MEVLTIILSVTFCFFASLYFYLTKKHNHWKSKGVKEIAPSLLFGSIKDRFFAKISFHEFYLDMYFKGENEPYLGFFEGMVPSLMIRDPDLIRSVLSKDFDHFMNRGGPVGDRNPQITKMMIILRGQEWKQVRTTVAPTFSTARIKRMKDMIEDCAQQMQKYIESLINKNGGESTGEIDIKETMSKFTLDVIASTAFGVTCNSFTDEKSEFAEKISKFNYIPKFKRFLFLLTLIFNVPTKIRDLLPISFFNLETVNYLANIIKETTKYRLENKVRRNDFLQLLMDAQKISSENGDHVDKNDEAISEDVAIAQSVLFFIAGYETSSTLLTMACYELAQNLPEQDKLRSEVREKIEQNGKLSYEDLNDLPYLDKVLSETLRLHPPVSRLDRVCTKDIKIGKVDLKKDEKICIPVFGLHMDPKYYPDPHLFNPERFSEEEKSKRHSYVYLPFGQGPRNCIGMRFALMSVKLCLAYLVNNFVMNSCPKTEIPFKYDKRSMLLKSDGGVYLQFFPC